MPSLDFRDRALVGLKDFMSALPGVQTNHRPGPPQLGIHGRRGRAAQWRLDNPGSYCAAGNNESMASLLTACSGFLFAVLWMDLIFDVQIFGHRGAGEELPELVLASIAGYYHRATTTSRPMSRLIALVMVILLGALGFQAARGHDPAWLLVTSAGLAGIPTMLALIQTVPNAVRLGHRTDSPPEQTRLARSICRDHLVCVGCVLAFLVVWVAQALVV
jgi:hypothetical protein